MAALSVRSQWSSEEQDAMFLVSLHCLSVFLALFEEVEG